MSHAEPEPSVRFAMNRFLHEGSVRLEDLDPVVHAVTDIQQAIDGHIRAMHGVAELLGRRRIRVVFSEVGVVGLVPVGAPVALVLAGIRVIHDHAMVAVTVGDVDLIGLLVDKRLGRQPQVLNVVAALAMGGLADLHQELAVLREFQNLIVEVGSGCGRSRFVRRAARRRLGQRGPGRCRRSRRCLCNRS